MGQRLIRLRDDPALPERWLKHRTRLWILTWASFVILPFAAPTHMSWAILLAIVAIVVGGFPARKGLFEEEWGLGAYLWYLLRSFLAGLGFWLLLAGTPTIVHRAAFAQWPVIALLATVLIVWNSRYADFYPWLVGASPLDLPDLEPHFSAILDRAKVGRPRLYRFGSPGGRLANALALPSLRKPAILLGETLLEFLNPKELAAIFAHEVAHLEHNRRRRLRWLTLGIWVNIGMGVLATPLSLAWFPEYLGTILWTWPFIMLWILFPLMVGRKSREVESDRRAVALCGDAEALVRALTKIHALARLPRRWSLEAERAATHPSLAHRIRAIRAVAGSGSRRLEAPSVIGSLTPGTFVVFEPDRVSWLEGVPPETPHNPRDLYEAAATTRSLRYSELLELRLRADLAGPVSLVATDRIRDTWSVGLQPQDVAAVQSALDAVDERLAPASTAGLPRRILTLCRDVVRNLLAGFRIPVMRRVDVATFQISADQLVVLFGLNVALFLAVDVLSTDLWSYWTPYRVITSGSWVSLLLFVGYVMARFEGGRITALALPVVVLSTYPIFFALFALWGLAAKFELLEGSTAVRQGLWYAYYAWLGMSGILAIRTVVGRWSPRIPVYAMLLIILVNVTTWYLPSPSRAWWSDYVDLEQQEEEEILPSPAQEEVLQLQPQLLQQNLADLRPHRPGVQDLYFVGFGAYADQDVFMKEVKSIRTLFDERFDTAGRSLALINNPKTIMRLPIATASNMALALQKIGWLMHREEDVLFLYLTTHGSKAHELSVTFWPLELQQIDPVRLRDLLDSSGIKWRVIVISACYSGGFIEPLKNDYTLIATAAAADKLSFGCGNDNEFTYFGKAYFDEALRQTYSFVDAFDRAKAAIIRREGAEWKTSSQPQIFVGRSIRPKLEQMERRLSAGAGS